MNLIKLQCGDVVRHQDGSVGMVEAHGHLLRVRAPNEQRLEWATWDPRHVVAFMLVSAGDRRWRLNAAHDAHV